MFNWVKRRKWLWVNTALIAVLVSLLGVQVLDKQDAVDHSVKIGIGNEKVITLGHAAYAAGSVDYTYDGVDDDVQFQVALDALPATGGRLVDVSAVQKNFSATVSRAIDNVIIEGAGDGSYFTNDGVTAIFDAGTQDGWVFRNFRTDAGFIDVATTDDYIIENVTNDTVLVGKTVRTATLVVAASDASANSKAQADYVCNGTNDEVEIQAAHDALPAYAAPSGGGGEVVLLEGNYHIEGDLAISNGLVIGSRSGATRYDRFRGTIIRLKGDHTITISAYGALRSVNVYAHDAFTGNAIKVENIPFSAPLVYDDLSMFCNAMTGTAVLIEADGDGVALASFGSLHTSGFEYGLYLHAIAHATLDSFINGNTFEEIVCSGSDKGVYFLGDLGGAHTVGIGGNIVKSLVTHWAAGATEGLRFDGEVSSNNLPAVYLWDYVAASMTLVGNKASNNGVNSNYIRGVFDNSYVNDEEETTVEHLWPMSSKQIFVVHPTNGDYQKLSDALAAVTGATAANRAKIYVLGKITDDGAGNIDAKSYVDVIGFGAEVELTVGYLRFANVYGSTWRDLKFRSTNTVVGSSVALFRNCHDDELKFYNCDFINENIGNSNHGVHVDGSADKGPEFNHCYFKGSDNDLYSIGLTLDAGYPTFYDCICEGGNGDEGDALRVLYGAPTLFNCLAINGGGTDAIGYHIYTSRNVRLDGCVAEPKNRRYSWNYDDANNGRFQPFAGIPYQVVGLSVRVDVANIGVTLDIGTAIAGAQVASAIDIGGVGWKRVDFSKETVAADAYLYATPSAPINDADIVIYYHVVYNYTGAHGIRLESNASATVNNSKFLASGASYGGYIRDSVGETEFNNSVLANLSPATGYALYSNAAQTDVPFFNSTFRGLLNNITSFAPEQGYGGAVFDANAFQYPAPGTDWTPQLEGAHLAASLGTKKCWIPLNFLKQGDEIVSYRLTGDAVEAAALTLDCKLVRINLADPLTTTDVAGGAIVQVDANGNFDVLVTLTAKEVVATDKQYVLELLGTTGIGDSITVTGAEVRVNRRG